MLVGWDGNGETRMSFWFVSMSLLRRQTQVFFSLISFEWVFLGALKYDVLMCSWNFRSILSSGWGCQQDRQTNKRYSSHLKSRVTWKSRRGAWWLVFFVCCFLCTVLGMFKKKHAGLGLLERKRPHKKRLGRCFFLRWTRGSWSKKNVQKPPSLEIQIPKLRR